MAEPKNLLECIYNWEAKDPNRILMTQPMGGGDSNLKHWTIKEALDESRRMANYLKSLNLEPGSKIAICSKNCSYWVFADLAIWMAGHCTVPIYPTLTADTVAYILEHSESKLLFVGKLDPVWDEMKTGVPAGLPTIDFPLSPPGDHVRWNDIIRDFSPIDKAVDRAPDEIATIIYTSGSTGQPKGVMQDFGTMLVCTKGLHKVIGGGPGDRYLSYLPMAHGMERWLGECATLYHSGHMFFAESLDTFVADLQRSRPTLFVSVPRLWLKFQMGVYKKMPPQKLARLIRIPILGRIVKKKILAGLGLDCVRFAGSGSAPIPAELIQWYRDLGLELLEGYGMTENFNYSHITMPGQSRPGYVGTTYPDVQCRIASDGEIQVKTPGAMRGYYKRPEDTAATFTEDGWLRTGDRGELDEIGRLRITGRTKEIFKTSKGKYVAPAPIENKLVNHPRIELCCVGGSGYPQPYAVVQLGEDARKMAATAAGKATLTKELQAHLKSVNSGIDSFEQLEFIAVIRDEWLPENGFLTPTMKIRRNQIEEAYKGYNDDWYAAGTQVIWQ